jgi:uncharacterized damage-inducible protein DinB
MDSLQLLLSQLDYTEWASQRLLEAAAGLPAEELIRDHGTADKSVLGTLVHIYAADRSWLGRVRQQAPAPFINDSDFSLDVLRRDWPAIFQGLRDWLATLDPESITNPVYYADLKGRPHSTPAWQIVVHVVNHGTHHRGQIAGFLRTMGHRPPPLDAIAYYRGM